MHHENKASFGMSAMYASVTEFVISDILPTTAAYLTCAHWSSALIFLSWRLYLTTEVHSGYDFPW